MDIHTLATHGIDVPTGLAAAKAIDQSFETTTSVRALQFYGDGTLSRVPAAMQKDLCRWRSTCPSCGHCIRDAVLIREVWRDDPHPTFPPELIRVARKVVWYDRPEDTLADLPTFLAHVMVYGSPADVALVEGFVPAEEFRRVLENAPAGLFTIDRWRSWHERFGMPVPPLPRRRFPDGSLGPEAGRFFGR